MRQEDRAYMAKAYDTDKADEAEKKAKRIERERQLRAVQDQADIKALANNVHFVRWLSSIAERAGLYSVPVCYAHAGPQSFDAGRLALGREILNAVEDISPRVVLGVYAERMKFKQEVDNGYQETVPVEPYAGDDL